MPVIPPLSTPGISFSHGIRPNIIPYLVDIYRDNATNIQSQYNLSMLQNDYDTFNIYLQSRASENP